MAEKGEYSKKIPRGDVQRNLLSTVEPSPIVYWELFLNVSKKQDEAYSSNK